MIFRNYITLTPIRRLTPFSDSSASNLLISDMSVSSVTWQYRFIMILTLECPKITCTVLGFMPRSICLVHGSEVKRPQNVIDSLVSITENILADIPEDYLLMKKVKEAANMLILSKNTDMAKQFLSTYDFDFAF